jgi:two-component system chemotaxis response regulator CheB
VFYEEGELYMKKVKVLITDDSIFMRKLLADLLETHPLIQVIATAKNGMEAIEKAKELSPDVITLDVEMPKMNGLEALKEIMKYFPTPVIMLSSTTSEGSLNTIMAMEHGAIDFVRKPSGSISLDIHKVKEELTEKILSASGSNLRAYDNRQTAAKKELPSRKLNSNIGLVGNFGKNNKSIVCIGTSTGGPRALQTLLSSLPKSIESPIFIVQHMPKHFTKSLADRLNTLCDITVTEAEHNQKAEPGTAYIAPGDYHMEILEYGKELRIHLLETPPLKGHRPSVDIMFTSISRLKYYKKIAVILTGMGADGSMGLQELKKNGAENTVAIAESEDTAVVYGMPKEAVKTGLVDEIHHLEDIADRIYQYTLS